MGNSQLYGKAFPVPSEVLKGIQTTLVSNPTGDGVRRAKFILKNGTLTYQDMKRLKNYFDHYNGENDAQYALAGGNAMKAFIDSKLGLERAVVKTGKKVRQDMSVDPNLGTRAYQTPRLNEEDKKKEEKQKNAVAVIVNTDNKILLLKRADIKDIWMPGKWALVGGMIEKGESPEKAVAREIKEEIGLDIDKFVKTFSIQRSPVNSEYIFACRYEGDPTDISLNEENTNYGWYDVDEMNYLDVVPNLIEYVTLAFSGKKYND
jgi:8-oxo-dGTP diphosphatase